MITYSKTIKDKTWTFVVLSDKKYEKNHGDDSCGITHPEEKYVYFKKSKLTMGYILHELFHVYVSMSLTTSMDIDRNGQEELDCEIFSEHGLDIYRIALELDTFFRLALQK